MTTILSPVDLERLRALLGSARRIAAVTHFNPDGDAVGCSLGLVAALKNAGLNAQVVLPNTPPNFLHWMPGYELAMAWDREPARCEAELRDADLVFALDFNRPDRSKGLEASLRAARNVVMIDHHQDPDPFATIRISDVNASSTCQMVFDVLHALGMEEHIDRASATALYAGIMTDTGGFRFSSTTPHTFRVAATLVEHGVDVPEVYRSIMEQGSANRLRLIGFALHERMEVIPEQGTVIFTLSDADLKKFQHAKGDTEGLVNEGLTIKGIRLSAYFMERGNDVKISVRSRGALPVNELMREHFGGGGHANAAGCDVPLSLAEALSKFRRVLPGFLAQYPE